jgi:hypothetical protein
MSEPMGQAETLLSASEEELFASLVPDSEKAGLNSFDGVVARGRIIFRSAFINVRHVVCPIYKKQGAAMGDEVQLVTLIAGSLVGQAVLGGIPIVPLAALMVKIGLSRLCASWTEPSE